MLSDSYVIVDTNNDVLTSTDDELFFVGPSLFTLFFPTLEKATKAVEYVKGFGIECKPMLYGDYQRIH